MQNSDQVGGDDQIRYATNRRDLGARFEYPPLVMKERPQLQSFIYDAIVFILMRRGWFIVLAGTTHRQISVRFAFFGGKWLFVSWKTHHAGVKGSYLIIDSTTSHHHQSRQPLPSRFRNSIATTTATIPSDGNIDDIFCSGWNVMINISTTTDAAS